MNGQIFYDIIYFILLIVLVPFLIKMGLAAKHLGNREGAYNSITAGILLTFISFYYLIASLIGNPLIIYPFNVLMSVWVGLIAAFQGLYIILNKKIKNKKYDLHFVKNEDFTFYHEMKRKVSHLVGILLIVCYFWISIPLFIDIQYLLNLVEKMGINIWGMVIIPVNMMYVPRMITLFAMFCTGYFIIIPDILRVFDFKLTMFKMFEKIMREKEKNAIGPHVCLVIGCLISTLLIPEDLIVVSGIIIAIFSDSVASLVGRKFGKHKLPFSKRTGKSYEGLLGGFLTAILVSFPILLLGYNLMTSIILSLIGGLVFSVIDILTPIITDNYLNPILICTGMYIIFLFI
ncbi:MAG: phosphatidate cytidylyltransferase [Candidatus Helarchaeota archaeon]